MGSSQAQFYDHSTDDPVKARLYEIEDQLNRWRHTGELWDTENEEVQNTLEEFEDLKHQDKNNAFDFTNEEWNEADPRTESDVQPADLSDNAEEVRDAGGDSAD